MRRLGLGWCAHSQNYFAGRGGAIAGQRGASDFRRKLTKCG